MKNMYIFYDFMYNDIWEVIKLIKLVEFKNYKFFKKVEIDFISNI